MACMLSGAAWLCSRQGIEWPGWLIAVLCIGVIYNPFGFFVQAIDPRAGRAQTALGRFAICAGFIPVTVGLDGATLLVSQSLLVS